MLAISHLHQQLHAKILEETLVKMILSSIVSTSGIINLPLDLQMHFALMKSLRELC